MAPAFSNENTGSGADSSIAANDATAFQNCHSVLQVFSKDGWRDWLS